jgi:hypothetical protein
VLNLNLPFSFASGGQGEKREAGKLRRWEKELSWEID